MKKEFAVLINRLQKSIGVRNDENPINVFRTKLQKARSVEDYRFLIRDILYIMAVHKVIKYKDYIKDMKLLGNCATFPEVHKAVNVICEKLYRYEICYRESYITIDYIDSKL